MEQKKNLLAPEELVFRRKFSIFAKTACKNLDMAIEATSLLRGEENREIPGVKEEIEHYDNIKATVITIFDKRGEELMGKKIGKYITVSIPSMGSKQDEIEKISSIVAQKLKMLFTFTKNDTVLLIGLGNNNAIPDALGPKVVDATIATRHIKKYMPAEMDQNTISLCALAPGVLGETGIETAEIIKGVVDHVKPSCIIVVDSLAAASIQRVGSTIQITDTGINPGSGMEGNKRMPISFDSMGVPVIALGVPTVVNTSFILFETVNTLIEQWQKEGYKQIPQVNSETIDKISKKMLATFAGNLAVTPKVIDALVMEMATILAAGIAQAVHPGVHRYNYHYYIK